MHRVPPTAVFALWIAALLAAYGWALRYDSTPGPSAVAAVGAARLPVDAGIELDRARPTLVCFAHPRCPCTRTTLGELERLVARNAGGLAVHILFYADPKLGAGWERTALWDQAERIPGAVVRADPLGAAAARCGARTSGDTLVYAPDGELLYAGGVTLGRGHPGDNAGTAAIASIVRGEPPAVRTAPVFGCELFAAASAGGAP